MAIPTFSSITPNTGYPGGGYIATIAGTNFRAVERDFTDPQGDYFPTVAVTVDGVDVEDVWAISDTELRVRIPTAQLNPEPDILSARKINPDASKISFTAVDVVITNLDDDGLPIAGETVTAASAYTYEQPLMRIPEGDPPLLQVLREFIILLRRCILSNADFSTHTDYVGDPDAFYLELAEHAAISLRMDTEKDPDYSHYDNEPRVLEVNPKDWQEYAMQTTLRLGFELTLSSKSVREVMHMASNLVAMQMATPWLVVPQDPRYPVTIADNKFPMEFVQYPRQIGSANRSNICAYTAQMVIRGVPVILGDPSTEGIKQRLTLVLATSDINGNGAVAQTF